MIVVVYIDNMFFYGSDIAIITNGHLLICDWLIG